ncbi:MAG: iron ABC transporter permease [Gammaproteobacteria bacterium]
MVAISIPSVSSRRSWLARHGLDPWHVAVFLAVFVLVATPLVLLILGSFSLAVLPTDISFSNMGLDNFEDVWLDPGTYAVFSNTFIYVTGATVFGVSIAAILAWTVERTNIPGKIWIYAGVPMTLAVPSMLQAMAWVLMMSPRAGFVNTFLMETFGLSSAPFNIYSIGGMIFIEGLRLVPTAFLMLVPLLRSMDPALEEAAVMSGASPMRSVRKVTLRLMAPGLTAVLIYQVMTALEVFEVPGILGLPAQIYVFSTKIYSILHTVGGIPEYGLANALGMFYLLLAVVATFLYLRVIAKSERYSIITGKGYRPKLFELGRLKFVAVGLVVLYLSFSIILPFLVLLFTSFLPYLQMPSWEAFASMTLINYQQLFSTKMIGTVMWNTMILVVVTSTAVVVFSFIISLVVVRSKFVARKFLDQLAFVPHAIPGIIMGLAFLWVFLQLDKWGIPGFGTVWAMALAFTVSYISYGTRTMNAAILQIHSELEEAAQISGAPPLRTVLRVFFPLLMPAFVGIWIWTMLHAVRTAGKPLILYEGADNQVLAILIWNMWDEGYVETVGAIGALLIAGLLVITIAVRYLGFGRGRHIQTTGM